MIWRVVLNIGACASNREYDLWQTTVRMWDPNELQIWQSTAVSTASCRSGSARQRGIAVISLVLLCAVRGENVLVQGGAFGGVSASDPGADRIDSCAVLRAPASPTATFIDFRWAELPRRALHPL
jgi:hypothetical protein